jgi:hypothetical protein
MALTSYRGMEWWAFDGSGSKVKNLAEDSIVALAFS